MTKKTNFFRKVEHSHTPNSPLTLLISPPNFIELSSYVANTASRHLVCFIYTSIVATAQTQLQQPWSH